MPTKKVIKPNFKLLDKVKKHILEEPRRFEMSSFVQIPTSFRDKVYDSDAPLIPAYNFAICNTAACIGGWASILKGRSVAAYKRLDNPDDTSMKDLGLTEDQANHLFYVSQWPHQFVVAYRNSTSLEEKARVAADRIDYFKEHLK